MVLQDHMVFMRSGGFAPRAWAQYEAATRQPSSNGEASTRQRVGGTQSTAPAAQDEAHGVSSMGGWDEQDTCSHGAPALKGCMPDISLLPRS